MESLGTHDLEAGMRPSRAGAFIPVMAITVALLFVTPPTKTFVDGMSSRDMWSGLRQRMLPHDHKWFGVFGDITAMASRKPQPSTPAADSPANDPAATNPISTGSIPAREPVAKPAP